MIYSDQISSALGQFRAYVEENAAYCTNHPAGKVSSFWEDHFADRRNFPDVGEFLSFRRESFVYGIGDTGPASHQKKWEEFNATGKSIQLFTPLEFIESLREPILGAPTMFQIGKSQLSASFVLNAGTTWRVKALLAQFGQQRPLHIAEIGAGWGACATQLHQACDVASYTIIDLPENLCLSSTYLSLVNHDRQMNFIDCCQGPTIAPAQGSLNFALPPAIDRLDGPYDVIINTMSFQEMDLETVQAYFQWAARALAQGGLLISFNAHDKAGITRPHQYFQDGLSLVHMAPFRKVPAGWFNTIPYEMVFKRTGAAIDPHSSKRVDVIGELIQLGLDSELRQFLDGAIQAGSEVSVLDRISSMLYPASEAEREKALREGGQQGNVVVDFLAANYWYGIGKMTEACQLLELCLQSGLKDFAKIRAQAMLAVMGMPVDRAAMLDGAAGLAGELAILVEDRRVSAFQNHIARVMDCPEACGIANGVIARAVKKVLRKAVPIDSRSAI